MAEATEKLEPATDHVHKGRIHSSVHKEELNSSVTKKIYPKSWKGEKLDTLYGHLKLLLDVVEKVVLSREANKMILQKNV